MYCISYKVSVRISYRWEGKFVSYWIQAWGVILLLFCSFFCSFAFSGLPHIIPHSFTHSLADLLLITRLLIHHNWSSDNNSPLTPLTPLTPLFTPLESSRVATMLTRHCRLLASPRHSLTRSLTHTITRSLPHSLTYSFHHSSIKPLTHFTTHPLTHSTIRSLTNSSTPTPIPSLTHSHTPSPDLPSLLATHGDQFPDHLNEDLSITTPLFRESLHSLLRHKRHSDVVSVHNALPTLHRLVIPNHDLTFAAMAAYAGMKRPLKVQYMCSTSIT
jgi:hypothetical protein